MFVCVSVCIFVCVYACMYIYKYIPGILGAPLSSVLRAFEEMQCLVSFKTSIISAPSDKFRHVQDFDTTCTTVTFPQFQNGPDA